MLNKLCKYIPVNVLLYNNDYFILHSITREIIIMGVRKGNIFYLQKMELKELAIMC